MLENEGAYNKAQVAYGCLVRDYPDNWHALYDYAVFMHKRLEQFAESIDYLIKAYSALKKSHELNSYNKCKIFISLTIAYMRSNMTPENYKKMQYYFNLAKKYKSDAHQDAVLLSLAAKVDEVCNSYTQVTKAKKERYENARRADEARFNKNHPLPTTDFAKVSCENNRSDALASAPTSTKKVSEDKKPEEKLASDNASVVLAPKSQAKKTSSKRHKKNKRRENKPAFEIKFNLTAKTKSASKQTKKQVPLSVPPVSLTEVDVGSISLPAEPIELSKQQLREAWKREGISQPRSKHCSCWASLWSKLKAPQLTQAPQPNIHFKK